MTLKKKEREKENNIKDTNNKTNVFITNEIKSITMIAK